MPAYLRLTNHLIVSGIRATTVQWEGHSPGFRGEAAFNTISWPLTSAHTHALRSATNAQRKAYLPLCWQTLFLFGLLNTSVCPWIEIWSGIQNIEWGERTGFKWPVACYSRISISILRPLFRWGERSTPTCTWQSVQSAVSKRLMEAEVLILLTVMRQLLTRQVYNALHSNGRSDPSLYIQLIAHSFLGLRAA